MTREEEREHAAYDFVNTDCSTVEHYPSSFTYFIKGAKWSDENPRKGLVDIDKAVKFLEQWDAYRLCVEGHKEFFIENFKKAMEE